MSDFAPNFLVIGAEKSGTTWLKHVLNEHPDIFVPPIKEVHFFDKDENFEKGIKWYSSFFAENREKCCGEITPGYLANSSISAQRIRKMFPEVKIIAILRNPVDRAISNYNMLFAAGIESRLIDEVLRPGDPLVDKGKYKEKLKPFFENFPRDSILIHNYDDLSLNPSGIIASIEEFLGLTPHKSYHNIGKRIFKGRKVRYQWINHLISLLKPLYRLVGLRGKFKTVKKKIFKWNTREGGGPNDHQKLEGSQYRKLLNYFEEDIAFLEDLWEIDLSHWRAA